MAELLSTLRLSCRAGVMMGAPSVCVRLMLALPDAAAGRGGVRPSSIAAPTRATGARCAEPKRNVFAACPSSEKKPPKSARIIAHRPYGCLVMISGVPFAALLRAAAHTLPRRGSTYLGE